MTATSTTKNDVNKFTCVVKFHLIKFFIGFYFVIVIVNIMFNQIYNLKDTLEKNIFRKGVIKRH